MREYPTLAIRIQSCTDSRGEATRNLTLSQAEAVATYLTDKGTSRKRITTIGLDVTQLLIIAGGASTPKPNVSAIGVPISAGWQ